MKFGTLDHPGVINVNTHDLARVTFQGLLGVYMKTA